MKRIPLTKGKVAIVDSETSPLLEQNSWCFSTSGAGTGYAVTSLNGKTIYMHVMVWLLAGRSIPDGYEVDHIAHADVDRTLDNRLANLRLATKEQNRQNRGPSKNKTSSKFKGVFYRPRNRKKWEASIQANGIKYYLGTFETEIAAALAYNLASYQYHGTFGYQNELST